jgi:hypothetical protein
VEALTETCHETKISAHCDTLMHDFVYRELISRSLFNIPAPGDFGLDVQVYTWTNVPLTLDKL